MLVYPALSFVVAATLIPKDANVDTDWHDYFYKIRTTLFGTMGFAMAAQVVVTGTTVLNHATYLIAAFVVIYTIGFYAESPKIQHAIAIVHALILAPTAIYGLNIPNTKGFLDRFLAHAPVLYKLTDR